MSKEIRGPVEVFNYKNGKLVSKRKETAILNEDHWKAWGKFDRKIGANAVTRSNFDYEKGTRLMTSYTTRYGNEKKVYKRIF